MSKWIMKNTSLSKVKHLFFTFILTFVTLFTLNKHNDSVNNQAQQLSACITSLSSLPVDRNSNSCNATNMANKSWISWLSGESKSTHLHFLDLLELIHYTFHEKANLHSK